jgi:hypothetical protein
MLESRGFIRRDRHGYADTLSQWTWERVQRVVPLLDLGHDEEVFDGV